MCAVVKVLSVGASVTVGVLVGDALARTPLSSLGETGEIVKNFCEAFATGIMTVRSHVFRQKQDHECAGQMFEQRSHDGNGAELLPGVCGVFERYAAELMQIDIERFEQETGAFNEIANKLDKIQTPAELNLTLRRRSQPESCRCPGRP